MYHDYDYDVLKSKIFKRLTGEVIQSNENVISLYDLNNILKIHYNKYISLYNLSKESEKLNNKLSSKIFMKRLPKIKNMKIIFENNIPFLKVIFENDTNDDNLEKFVTYGLYNGSVYINNHSENKKFENEIYDFTNLNSKNILKYLYLAEEFVLEYNDMESKLANSKKVTCYNDGFLTSHISINNPNLINFTLTSKRDFEIAISKRDLVEGELIDYLEFYKDDVEKRTAIDLNKIPSYIKSVVEHYYENNKTVEKKLKK